MEAAATYQAPTNRFLRWIAEIGPDLPEEVRSRLRAPFFTSKLPLVVGAFNTALVAATVFASTRRPVFLFLALTDLALLGVRLGLLRRTTKPSGPVFATGLLWSVLQGTTIALVIVSENLVLSTLVLASGLAAIGGIVGRNFAAPRYAMTQVIILDGCFKVPFCFAHPSFIPLILFQSAIFVVMNLGIIRQHRTMAIEALQGEIANRSQALTDPLTGLANRRSLEDVDAGLRAAGADRTLLFLDLDGFKQINDQLGHGAGDRLLQEVATRLTTLQGPIRTVCRLGGDEFLILAEHLDADGARALAAGAIARLSAPYKLEPGQIARIGVSVGIAVDPAGAMSLSEMMMLADQALYAAKASGKGRCVLSDDPKLETAAA